MEITINLKARTASVKSIMAGGVFRMHDNHYMVIDRNMFSISLSGKPFPLDESLIIDLSSGMLYRSDGTTMVFPVEANLEVSE